MKEKIRYLPDCEMKSAFQKVRFRPLTNGSGREFRALCRTIKGFEKRYNICAESSAEEQHILSYAKALEQVRPGGANRLPNNAFRANAGTDVVSDIIFLQKRDRPIEIEPDWVHTGIRRNPGANADGFAINQYFIDHPEMVPGRQTSESTQYGRQDF